MTYHVSRERERAEKQMRERGFLRACTTLGRKIHQVDQTRGHKDKRRVNDRKDT